MAEKIKLKNGTKFDLIPMGIKNKDNLRLFLFTSDLSHENILEEFNEENIKKVEYILADDSIGATYEDCVVLKSLTFVPSVQVDDNTLSDVYMATISTDAIERNIQHANKNIQITMDTINTLLLEFIPSLMM